MHQGHINMFHYIQQIFEECKFVQLQVYVEECSYIQNVYI